MMSVPLDVQLCRLVIFGAVLGIPCEGIVSAAAMSVTDPFTLPSQLIIKDPREFAEALKRSYETRCYFDHGHQSEPIMLRNLFVHFLCEFRKAAVGQAGRRRGREPPRAAFMRCAQSMGGRFAIVPKRIVNLANAVLDTSTRMRKFIPAGSAVLKQIDAMLALLNGTMYFATAEAS